jgi:type IV fimbrial biogenesis protein FimT
MNTAGQHNGFTLIELIVTIAVAAILVTAGIPSFQQFVQNNRRTAQVDELVTALQIARSEAIRQNTNVGVCASDNPQLAAPTCGTNWNKGWIVFVDKNVNKTADSSEVINVYSGLDGSNSLSANIPTAPLIYQASGLSTTCGTFTLADSRGVSESRWVIVSSTGAIRTSDTNDSTCS